LHERQESGIKAAIYENAIDDMRNAKEILDIVLKERNIVGDEAVREFLSDRPQKTYDPFLLLNMEAGVDLLLSEINSGGKICIYGDYDADGVTSICVLSHIIGMLTNNFTYYIPSRFDEGYGLNKDALKSIRGEGTDLLVTVDCGSVSYDEVEYAKELGMKVIVTDHHTIDDVQADCILINPKQKGCGYPFKELAGCGVVFKMAQAICRKAGLPRSTVNDVLDLVAVGTVGDIVSLTDENRTIVKYGLNRINAGGRRSLKRLMEAISIDMATSENIAFGIAPHINAAGRMASAKEAAELFLSSNDDTNEDIDRRVSRLVALNAERKKMQEDAYDRCMEMISGDENFVVLKAEGIHEGISGIVAGKIKEAVNRPVIILTQSGDGFLKGTGRSVENVDIYGILKNHKELFTSFGGHRSACGFLIKEEYFEKLKDGITRDIDAMLDKNEKLFEKKAMWDVELSAEEVTVELAKELDRMEPFGQGNAKPVFRLSHVVPANIRFMGSDGAHAGFTVVSGNGKSADCILFRRAQEKKDLIIGNRALDITGTVNLKRWKGRESVQFVVEEMESCR